MSATRAVVLARGLGTRMRSSDPGAGLSEAQRRAADAGMKAMMPIRGRPFLDFVLSSIADAGLRHVALVVAPEHDELRRYYRETAPPFRLSIEFVVQPEALGTANAVLAVEGWTGAEAFLVMNSDNLYPVQVLEDLAALREPGLPAFDREDLVRSSNIEPDRVRGFAILQVSDDGYLTSIVEKPSPEAVEGAGPHAAISMNCWRFDAGIFDACRAVPRSPRGEFELPMAVGLAVDAGARYRVIPARGPVLDLSRRADALEVERRLSGATPQP